MLKSSCGLATVIAAIALGGVLSSPAHAGDARPIKKREAACVVPQELAWAHAAAVEAANSFHAANEIRIVALGSSSTAGVGASKSSLGYAAALAAELQGHSGAKRITFKNAGISGETTEHMLRRLDRDVIAMKPHIVIWQTGVNDAVYNTGVAKFEKALRDGLDRMRKAGVYVILVNQQPYPGALKKKHYGQYVATMDRVARETQTALLSRYAVMQFVADHDPQGLKTLLASDNFHMNDRAHRCISDILAERLGTLIR